MKTFLKLSLLAAMLMFAATSCYKQDKAPAPGANLKTETYAAQALKIEMPEQSYEVGIRSIEFTGDGTALVWMLRSRYNELFGDKDAEVLKGELKKLAVRKGTDKDDEWILVLAAYVYSEGVYDISGIGSVSADSEAGTVTIQLSDEQESTVISGAKVNDEPAAPGAAELLCRSWKVRIIDFNIKGGDLKNVSGGRIFRHGNLDVIAKAAEEDYGFDFKGRKVEGYNIESVTFTPAGTFLVQFSEADAFVGEYILDESTETFSYVLEQGGNDILKAEAEGTLSFGASTCVLSIAGTFTADGKEYTTKLGITFEQLSK